MNERSDDRGGDTERLAGDGTLLVGVDGGGTKTVAVVGRKGIDGQIECLSYGIAGPANIQTVSAEQAWGQCCLAIDRAFAALGNTPDRLDAVAFAMAGEGSPPHRQAFISEVERSGRVGRIIVSHDARPLIAGGTPDDCGIALIAGTGSFAFCRTAAGEEDRCGGWGYLYGDDGSGYSVAIAGLRAAVSAADGRAEPTDLLPALSEWIGEPDPRRWLPTLRQWNPEQVAAAAGVVCRVAFRGDAVAANLVDRAGEDLATHLFTLWRRRFAGEPVSIVLTGGLLIAEQPLRERVLAGFTARGGICEGHRLISRPVDTVLHLFS